MITEDEIKEQVVIQVAQQMLVAAKTAPKGKGVDNIVAAVLTGDEIKKVSDHLLKMEEAGEAPEYFARDAGNLLQAQALFLIGTKVEAMGVAPCGNCGFKNCAEKNKFPDVPCSFNTGDLGIAVGSAVSLAIDNRVDNRVMYTVGIAAKQLGILGADVKIIYGIPLTSASKNPFFDRK
ncbi:MAG: hypothetical protein JEZ04_02870 [Spirochaetales bacterium]|nr:hypothetical protein [Spirochaetales bacterium]